MCVLYCRVCLDTEELMSDCYLVTEDLVGFEVLRAVVKKIELLTEDLVIGIFHCTPLHSLLHCLSHSLRVAAPSASRLAACRF
jgi:hypothetical protein